MSPVLTAGRAPRSSKFPAQEGVRNYGSSITIMNLCKILKFLQILLTPKCVHVELAVILREKGFGVVVFFPNRKSGRSSKELGDGIGKMVIAPGGKSPGKEEKGMGNWFALGKDPGV